jgi:hypothetical protein
MAPPSRKNKEITEFGDFQTPDSLALHATWRIRELGINPRSIIEPTCGRGAFLAAAATVFQDAERLVGMDINAAHLQIAGAKLLGGAYHDRVSLRELDFFKVNWGDTLREYPRPWLILGNPPWVTNSELGSIASANLPEKSNFQDRMGIEAITGKSNFDISEWMVLRYLDWLEGSEGTVAVLCKTAVARKVLLHAWRKRVPVRAARIYKIDALANFEASVDACFFVLEAEPQGRAIDCDVFDYLDAPEPSHTIGSHRGVLVNDMATFGHWQALFGPEERYTWRSGIKHDCSKVMELVLEEGGSYRNGLQEAVNIEDTYLFPMFKSSDVANGRLERRSVMLVTQRSVGEDTAQIKAMAPRTWGYLQEHATILGKRGSVIYRNKPPFSIFGVGGYSFAPWKVAISGFYKKLEFVKVGPLGGRPVVFDDTVYLLPCWSEDEASFLAELLDSEPARAFLHSMIHWDEKRPITAEILRRLSIQRLAVLLERESDYWRFARRPLERDSTTARLHVEASGV